MSNVYTFSAQEFNNEEAEAPYESEAVRAKANMADIKNILRRPVA